MNSKMKWIFTATVSIILAIGAGFAVRGIVKHVKNKKNNAAPQQGNITISDIATNGLSSQKSLSNNSKSNQSPIADDANKQETLNIGEKQASEDLQEAEPEAKE